MSHKFLLLIASLLFSSGLAFAQRPNIQFKDRLKDTLVLKDVAEKAPRVKKQKALASEFSIGPTIYTDGYGISGAYARQFGEEKFGNDQFENFYNNNFLQIDLQERLHPKEFWNLGTTLNSFSGGSYTYAKINNVFVGRLVAGQRRMLGGFGESGAVKVHYYYAVGLAVAVLKPYLLQTSSSGLVAYNDSMPEIFLDQNNIIGKGGIGKGWDSATVNIGATAKFGLHIDFAQRRRGKSAIDIGVSIDYYGKAIPQMATVEPKKTFANFFISYQIGRRY